MHIIRYSYNMAGMNIDGLTIQIFLAVAETKSFTQAAARIGRTQSAISQQISKLEDQLGKPLFTRTKELTLTPHGELFIGYARQIDSLQREVLERFREPELKGEIRFGIPEDFASVYLSDVLVEFTHLHPRILLNIECDLTLNLYDRFKTNEFDLVLVKMSRPEDFPGGVDVWSEELVWVGDQAIRTKLEHLEGPLPLVLSPTPCVYRASAINALNQQGQPWRLVFTSPSFASTIAAVKAGMGVTVLPRTMIPQSLEALSNPLLPQLEASHLSLLKYDMTNPALQSFEEFVMRKLLH